jgi:hypothetical protein
MPPSARHRTLPWLLFGLSALIAIALFFIPAYVIQPFKHQAANALAVSMALRQRAPWGTLIAALFSLALVISLWPASNLWRKIVLVVIMLPVVFSTVMARLNYFEWMFHPIESQQFESASASKLAASEMILTVRFGSDARAYPIREMAYHHILNDVVEGVPIAVTY